jgi:hypothetical protein
MGMGHPWQEIIGHPVDESEHSFVELFFKLPSQ